MTSPLLIGFIILCVISVVLLGMVIWMYRKLQRFLIGFDSDQVGDSLTFLSSGLGDLQQFRGEIETYLASVEKRLKKSVQAVHTVRFNPYHGTGEGGNQSFATAILSEEGDGVVISSLHSRDHVRVFSKPVKNNIAAYELSDEEREAIEAARALLSN